MGSLRIYFSCIARIESSCGKLYFYPSNVIAHPMTSSRSTNFCKNEDCPSSQELLDFQIGDTDRERGVDIRIHMGICEFCTAEVEFYSRFPQISEDTDEAVCEIPASLYEFAQALLRNPHRSPPVSPRTGVNKEFIRNVF